MKTFLGVFLLGAVASLALSRNIGKVTCPSGYYSNGLPEGTRPCPLKTFQPFPDKTFCYPCGNREVTDKEGSTRCRYQLHSGFTGQSTSGRPKHNDTGIVDDTRGESNITKLVAHTGNFSTPLFPHPYPTYVKAQWKIECPSNTYTYVIFFTIDLRIGDMFLIDNKVIVGKFPFYYHMKLSRGPIDMKLTLNSTDRTDYEGIQGAYVCIDEEWYEKWPSLPMMIFENQYSLKILKARPDLRKSFFDIFMDYEKKWLNVLTDTNLSTHLYNVISIVYNGSEVPFMLFG